MKIKKILFIMALFLIPTFKANAASFNVSASSKSVTVGSSVTVNITGSDVTGKVSISSSNPSVLSGGAGDLWIEPSGSVTFKANKVGSSTITISSSSLSDGEGNDVNLGSKSITINVIEKAEQKKYSSNNSLKSLSVEGYELDPVFDAGTTEYSVTVKEGTEIVNILAVAEDSEASINGKGEINVSEGLNVVKVVVTAENGQEKVYVLNITVDDHPITVQIGNKDYNLVKQVAALPAVSSYYQPTTIQYTYKEDGEEKVIELPAYFSDVTGYTLVGLKDDNGTIKLYIYDKDNNSFEKYSELTFNNEIVLFIVDAKDIPKEYKKTTIKIGENEITAYQKDKNSDFYLIYGMNVDSGNTGWYHYDSVDNTIQRYDVEEINNLTYINNRYYKTIIVLGAISIVLTFFTMISAVKNRIHLHEKKAIE